jgi:PTH1 family peptidyl-tRNA hydrolase
MKLIVGLGNPGDTYIDSRHNIGFFVVDCLSKEAKCSFKRDRGMFALTCRAKLGVEDVILAKPVTFMNLSGGAAKALIRKYKVEAGELLVVCDDLDLELGRIRIRLSGSAGGHHGLESIIGSIQSNEFARLRVGIGRPHPGVDTSDYVLARFTRREFEVVDKAVQVATACVNSWAAGNMQETMNVFNKRSREE